MTNHWIDIRNSDVILSIGGNASENHPISFKWVTQAKLNGGTLIHCDPRFTRTAAVADIFGQLRSGTDVAFFGGIINHALTNNLFHEEYVKNYTTASWMVKDSYGFEDGLFSGFNKTDKKYDSTMWDYEPAEEAVPIDRNAPPDNWAYAVKEGVPFFEIPVSPKPKKDPSLKNPNTVFQLMKEHYSRYTSDMVSKITGIPKDRFEEIAKTYCSTGEPGKSGTIMYAMGLTQHTNGSQIIRSLAILQLLLGNIGVAGGGVNALRGESNVQGSTDIALLFHIIPAYMPTPNAGKDPTLADYLAKETPAGGWWVNRPKYFISLLKSMYGDNATLENDFAYDFMPKLEEGKNYSHIPLFEAMAKGTIKGFFLWGQNPAVSGPNCKLERQALEKLEWLVVADLWETESAQFWKAPGKKPEEIDTEVFLLPAAAHFEKEGSISNSGRWIQWRWKAVEPLGDAKSDIVILNEMFKVIREEYNQGGKVAGAITDLLWDYSDDEKELIKEVAKEINGYTVSDGKPVEKFTLLQADGSTACGNWIYSGYFNQDGKEPAEQPAGRRDNTDETGIGSFLNWSFSWPVNRRIIYNRGSANPKGEAYDKDTPVAHWDGKKWVMNDVPDFKAADADGNPVPPDVSAGNAFIMLPEGAGRIFAKGLKDGPLPEHYEPYESPVKNLLSNQQNDPVVILFESAKLSLYGSKEAEKFPIVMTTFRLTEHWQTGQMTRNLPWLVEIMPTMFVELSPELAEDKEIESGDTVVIFNNRGSIEAKAMVTERIRPFKIGDKTVHEIATPWHWGFAACTVGGTANDLTPNVGDANTLIPEYKAFLVDIRKGEI